MKERMLVKGIWNSVLIDMFGTKMLEGTREWEIA